MTLLTLHIDGMSCGHCLNAVNRSLAGQAGVVVKSVAMGRAEVDFDPTVTSEATILAAVKDAGYSATPVAL